MQSKIKNNSKDLTSKQHFEKAKIYLLDSNFEKAKEHLTQLLFDKLYNQGTSLYLLLGISDFNFDDIMAAKRHFMTVLEMDEGNVLAMLYLAVISVLIGSTEESVSYFLEAQAMCVTDNRKKRKYTKYITKGMNVLKKNAVIGEDTLQEMFNNPYKFHILPKYETAVKRKRMASQIIRLLIIAVILGLGLWFIYANMISPAINRNDERIKIIEQLEHVNANKNIQVENDSYVELTERQYTKLYNTIKEDFVRNKDNEVWINANIILNSNVSQANKEKVILITKNLKETDYTDINTKWYSYKEIFPELWKYNNIVIKWKGTVVSSNADASTRQFLVDFYNNSTELSATVDTVIPSHITLNGGEEVELLARLTLNENNDIVLHVLSFRHLLQ